METLSERDQDADLDARIRALLPQADWARWLDVIRAARPPATPASRQARLVRDFKQAWEARDIDALIGLLDADATAIADGGGVVGAVLRPIEGAEQIVRSLVHLEGRLCNLTILERTVNGQPGLIAQQESVTVSVYAFEVAGDRITHIWALRNPDKLRPWTTRRRHAGHAGARARRPSQ
jgi:hypothetical protein